jgi:hypothetical protein
VAEREPLIPGGCILLARKIIESEIWDKPPLYIKIWIFLLTSAQHSKYKGLRRGQVLMSIPDIMDGVSWRVGARVVRPTKDQVFQVLEFLRGKAMKSKRNPVESNAEATTTKTLKETMITTMKATHQLLITIDNYGVYQDFRSYESNDDSNDDSNDESNGETETGATRKQRQPDNTNKNVKNVKNDKKEDLKPKPSSRQQKTYAEDSLYFKMARYFYDRVMAYAASISKAHLVEGANLQVWADEFRKLVELKKRDKDEIRQVIDWVTTDDFWQKNVLSAAKFREKYDELCIKMADEFKKKSGSKGSTPNRNSYRTTSGKPKMDLIKPGPAPVVSDDRLAAIREKVAKLDEANKVKMEV